MYHLAEFCARLHGLTRKEAIELIEEEINFLEAGVKANKRDKNQTEQNATYKEEIILLSKLLYEVKWHRTADVSAPVREMFADVEQHLKN